MPTTWEDVRHRLVDSSRKEPKVPCHWPKDKGVIKVDCWKRKPWLPPRFGQALKETSGGTVLECYVTPDGKLYYHKPDLANGENVELSNQDWLEMDGLGRGIEWVGFKTGSANCGNQVAKLAVPKHWPMGSAVDPGRRTSWLPASWGQGVVFTDDGRCVKYYVSPDGKQFWHKKKIEKIFFGGKSLPCLNLATNGRGDPVDARADLTQGFYRLLDPVPTRGKMLKRRRILQPKKKRRILRPMRKAQPIKRKAQPSKRGKTNVMNVAKQLKRCKPPGQLLGCPKCRYSQKGCGRCRVRVHDSHPRDVPVPASFDLPQEVPLPKDGTQGQERWRALLKSVSARKDLLRQISGCDVESLAMMVGVKEEVVEALFKAIRQAEDVGAEENQEKAHEAKREQQQTDTQQKRKHMEEEKQDESDGMEEEDGVAELWKMW